ncbi:MAG: PD-(D/E)XK nuclease family protein, partial [Bacteroidales bacterium]|nr:PD-(D/E)XK nuclease family protein [Bacteroidales bacterium]
TEDDVENVLEDFNLQGIIDKNERAELSVIIHKLISKPEIKPFFEKGIIVKAEEEILLPDGQKYRPDRVVFIDDRVIVIDYKTGKAEEKHKNQINKYADLIKEMGYEKVEKYLLYIGDVGNLTEP